MAVRRVKYAGVSEQVRARHAWLELIQTDGPFLALPVVNWALPNGLPEVPKLARARTRALVATMMSAQGAAHDEAIKQLIEEVLRGAALDWREHLLLDAQIPAHLSSTLPGSRTVSLRPDFAFHVEDAETEPDADIVEDEEAEDDESADDDSPAATPTGPADGLADESEGEWRLLGTVLPWGQHPLERRAYGETTASAVERLAALLRAKRVPVGITTDGRWWAVVWAPIGGATGVGIWDASLFSTEPDSFAAFATFLGRDRFINAQAEYTLPRLLRASLSQQEEVTETLGKQVRDAVEMLVAKFDQLDAERDGTLLGGVDDDEFYSGIVTVMMRIVFLLFAEERRLLPSDHDVYARGYSVGHLVEQLRRRRSYAGEEALRDRTAAWHRLLATARAIHSGVQHEDLHLPAYGSELFDPDRYPWLEGRKPGQDVSEAPAPAIDDLTVLQMLEAVQYVTIGGESRRLTFRALDVEQIGYVYEGLLELEVHTAQETMLGLARPPKWPRIKAAEVKELTCEVPLAEVASKHAGLGEKDFTAWISGYTVGKAEAIAKALARQPTDKQRLALGRAVGEGTETYREAEPYLGLIRLDGREVAAVVRKGGRYVTRSSRRASSGTHYTPRRLAEEVVTHALDPLVHRPGPLETGDSSQWELRPSPEILALRVADIAMGSGAFLVAACRYLADKVVRALELEGDADALLAAQHRTGQRTTGDAEADEVLLRARRDVAQHCLYGVDINPLAVSMAKLSLWLITMDRERPFGFLDDRFACGDSLLGLTSLDQLEAAHIDAAKGRKLNRDTLDFAGLWRPTIQKAATLRRRITTRQADTIRDIETKMNLLAEARETERSLVDVADAVTAAGLRAAAVSGKQQDSAFVHLAFQLGGLGDDGDTSALGEQAQETIQAGRPAGTASRTTLHWPLAFPEVFADTDTPGFDAIIGNPPFLGGKKISGALGDDYLAWLRRWDANDVKGSADLASWFVLRAEKLLGRRGQLGFVTVNSVVETVTMAVGLDQVAKQLYLWRARSPHPWPTASANIQIVEFWASRIRPGSGAIRLIDGEEVPSIGPDLQILTTVPGAPLSLRENEDLAFIGSYILGLGFTLTDDEHDELVARDSRNAEVIQPYIIGKDLSQRPDCSASRWVINFHNWPLASAEGYPDLIEIVRNEVKQERDQKKGADYRKWWWQFGRRGENLYEKIKPLRHVLAMSQVGSTLMPARVESGPVFGHTCTVFALEDFTSLALLSSSAHTSWVIRYTSTMRTDIRYSHQAVFLTFPRPYAHEQPEAMARLETLGQRLDSTRRELMLSHGWGLTKTYNNVRDRSVTDPEVQALREIHREIDHTVFAAYGWSDIDPEVGFHETKIGVRWTVSKEARFEILDRLRTLNQQRYDAQPK